MSKIQTEFKIPAENLEILKDKLSKLNRRAQKLGCPPISFQEVRDYEQTFERTLPTGKTVKFTQLYKIVKVEGDSPRLNGWMFVAKVEVTPAGILINAVPGEEVPHRYRENKSQCEHCNHNRPRRRLYIVRTETGEYKQIGASCLRDFLGHRNPEMIARILEAIRNADQGMSDGGGRGQISVHTLDVLALAHSIIRLYGYTSRKEADATLDAFHNGLRHEAKTATAELVWKVLFPPNFDRNSVAKAEYEQFCAKVKVDAEDEKAAETIQTWMANLNPTSDYLNNLQVISQLDTITPNRIGVAASGVWAYLKEVEKFTKQHEALINKSNEHVGNIKDRQELTLILKNVQIKSGTFQDEVALVNFEDEAGNAFVWWTNSIVLEKDGVHWKGSIYQLNTKFRVKATVKRHGEYKGRLTTTLNRCSVIEILTGE